MHSMVVDYSSRLYVSPRPGRSLMLRENGYLIVVNLVVIGAVLFLGNAFVQALSRIPMRHP